jgi:multidrug efflux pump subunit AcrB
VRLVDTPSHRALFGIHQQIGRRLFREFSVTVTAAILVSMVV